MPLGLVTACNKYGRTCVCTYMHLVTNTQISHGPKKADRPEIRFAIKQHRNHLLDNNSLQCVMQIIPPKCLPRPVKCGKKVGPCRFLLGLEQCVQICSLHCRCRSYTTPRKGDSTSCVRIHGCKGCPSFNLSVEESHGKHIGRRG